MKWIKEDVLSKLRPFKDLLQLEREMAQKRVTVYPLPGQQADIDRDEIRPWHVLPNIRKFGITLMPYDWLLSLFGMLKKYESTKEFWVWRNSNANRYIDYMFKRLRKEVELKEYHRARKTLWRLMNSEAYQISALNHVLRNWHRHLKWVNVKRTLLKVRKLCKEQATEIKFARVYIPKDENDPTKGYRPLGVPTWEWRIYLHMYNNLITQWRLVTEGENQHGYLPKRGVITAWKRVAELLTDMPNVYEADFKGFFDSIDIKGLTDVLWSIGLPALEAAHIEALNRSLPKLTEKDLVKEVTRQVYLNSSGKPNPDMDMKYDTENLMSQWIPLERANQNPELHLLAGLTTVNAATKPYQTVFAENFDRFKHLPEFMQFMTKGRGVPQGAPTSCSLATLAFRPLEKQMDSPISTEELESPLIEKSKLSEDPENLNRIIQEAKEYYEYRLSQRKFYFAHPTSYWKQTMFPPASADEIVRLAERIKKLEATLQLVRKHRGKGKIVLYADDVIYFPWSSEEDPKHVLDNPKLGIEVHEGKSGWSKVNHVWIKESVKFLGMRYFPSRKIEWRKDLNPEDIMIILGLCYPLDLIMFNGWPWLTALGLLTQGPVLYYRTRERFVAETRKGATLEFTTKESFIAWLDIMRDALVNGSISKEMVEDIERGRYTLKMWLDDEYRRWKLSSSHGGNFKVTYPIKWLWRTKLVGYFFSRMQSDSWHISVEQDFRLKPVEGSWVWKCWPTYANKWGLEQKELNVFNASSFACNDLMDWLRRVKQLKRADKKSKVRYVFTKASSKRKRKANSNGTERSMKHLWATRSNRNPRR